MRWQVFESLLANGSYKALIAACATAGRVDDARNLLTNAQAHSVATYSAGGLEDRHRQHARFSRKRYRRWPAHPIGGSRPERGSRVLESVQRKVLASRQAVPGRGSLLWRSPLRSDFAAMLGLGSASRNSLRALRPLRSNRRDESVNEARKRARPQAEHRSRHRNEPLPGTACREPTWWATPLRNEHQPCRQQSRVRAGRGASLRGAWVCLISWPRACALRELTRRTCLSVAASGREASCATWPRNQANPGESVRSTDRLADAPRPARTRLASDVVCADRIT